MKFKIGEVSKILDIPMQTLRFYESKNIVKPSKDHINKYRYYDEWDINFLAECKKYKCFDFKLAEVEEIIHNDSLSTLIERMDER
ncbi:MerR family transcriptional regulator [Alkalibacter mobilis]|uniref:MerR family transcriptional regulator n=1 Tax=Alkalibacter mobilis TaxID=2787712 RepID=UPI00189E55D6|nr:MerR family transcriptional regulator [Alkalibacter mobilis]MBF7097869.1 MerR family transcriptional regulator [Alkalibacter mobilis]